MIQKDINCINNVPKWLCEDANSKILFRDETETGCLAKQDSNNLISDDQTNDADTEDNDIIASTATTKSTLLPKIQKSSNRKKTGISAGIGSISSSSSSSNSSNKSKDSKARIRPSSKLNLPNRIRIGARGSDRSIQDVVANMNESVNSGGTKSNQSSDDSESSNQPLIPRSSSHLSGSISISNTAASNVTEVGSNSVISNTNISTISNNAAMNASTGAEKRTVWRFPRPKQVQADTISKRLVPSLVRIKESMDNTNINDNSTNTTVNNNNDNTNNNTTNNNVSNLVDPKSIISNNMDAANETEDNLSQDTQVSGVSTECTGSGISTQPTTRTVLSNVIEMDLPDKKQLEKERENVLKPKKLSKYQAAIVMEHGNNLVIPGMEQDKIPPNYRMLGNTWKVTFVFVFVSFLFKTE